MKKIILLIFTLLISMVCFVGCYYTPSEVNYKTRGIVR